MAVELANFDIGWLKSTADYRNSAIQGTTYAGPSGSAQFLVMNISTAGGGDMYFGLFATTIGYPIGVLQDKPTAGGVGTIRVVGVTKLVSGSTAIVAGNALMPSTAGTAMPWSAGTGIPFARALEGAGSVGAVFTAYVNAGFTST